MSRERTPEQQAEFRKLVDDLWAYAEKWTPTRDADGKGIDAAWTIGLVANLWDALGIPIVPSCILMFQSGLVELARLHQTCNCEGCQKNRKAAAESEKASCRPSNPSVN